MTEIVKFDDIFKNVITTSLKVAEVFEKQHKHVLRDIDNLLSEVKSNQSKIGLVENAYYIKESSYVDAKGETRRMFKMNKDFFTLLAMGFNGEKALKFKLQYISAFNAMERELKRRDETRLIGKQVRHSFTDTINLTLDKDGSDFDKFSFSLYSDLIYKKVFGITARQYRRLNNLPKGVNIRNYLGIKELNDISNMEDYVRLIITKNNWHKLPAKESYNKVKEYLNI
jgi:Rha family phage regulatory protein